MNANTHINVAINGTTVLPNFEVAVVAGAVNRALVQEFLAVADGSGNITIAFTTDTNVPADIYLVYLPSYTPELSKIEPIWNDVKQHYLPTRSYEQVDALKKATDDALKRKAENLRLMHLEITNYQRMAA